ncbi:MAG: Crp/Fnr family transcriptional regulator, partial [Clostridia bacterium]|nr:Crp/Fnr family transcriptional regulator [Clostridia bacterium]
TLDGGLRMVSATALSKVELTYISAEQIKKLILAYPEIALFIIKSIGIKLRWTTLQVEDLSALHKIPYRLANLLLNFNKYGVFTSHKEENCLSITHEELASFISTSRPKVTTYLNEFASKGIIETKRGQIKILDTKALQKYLEDEMFTI